MASESDCCDMSALTDRDILLESIIASQKEGVMIPKPTDNWYINLLNYFRWDEF